MKTFTIYNEDCLEALKKMAAESVHCCVTSPPYFGLRDYGVKGQIGLEETPDQYVARLVEVFREVKRVLRKDGTLWLNLGDSYAGGGNGGGGSFAIDGVRGAKLGVDKNKALRKGSRGTVGCKAKDLIGIPWMVAFALRADGWYLRQDIIWSKPNPMPESVRDRCTKAHEYIFMLTKSPRYFYDAAAIRNPPSPALILQVEQGYNGADTKDFGESLAQSASGTKSRIIESMRARVDKQRGHSRRHAGFNGRWDKLTREEQQALGSNRRSVWTVATKPFKGAHFATFPKDLIVPCIKAGCPSGGVVLDPFAGSGTTGEVALALERSAVLVELNPEYVTLIRQRLEKFKQDLFGVKEAISLP